MSISRRSFSQLAILSIASLCAAPARAGENLKFELYADKAEEFRWRLKATNGKVLATSGEGYKAKADAKKGIARIREDADKLTFETYEDDKHEHRWRLKAKNGQTIGVSSEGYASKEGAENAIALIKRDAKSAVVEDLTK